MEVFTDQGTIAGWTDALPDDLRVSSETEEEIAQRDAAAADRPGFIPWITNFSRIIQFARNATGEAYCFDFRDDPQKPSVIYLDECSWRQVAPDFDTYVNILEPYDGRQSLEDRDYEIQRKRNS